MARNIMMNKLPEAVTGRLDPCTAEGTILTQCFSDVNQHISYSYFNIANEKEWCKPERMALDRCRELHHMPSYHDMRKQDDTPRAPFRKHPSASDRMVQEYYPYPGGRIP